MPGSPAISTTEPERCHRRVRGRIPGIRWRRVPHCPLRLGDRGGGARRDGVACLVREVRPVPLYGRRAAGRASWNSSTVPPLAAFGATAPPFRAASNRILNIGIARTSLPWNRRYRGKATSPYASLERQAAVSQSDYAEYTQFIASQVVHCHHRGCGDHRIVHDVGFRLPGWALSKQVDRSQQQQVAEPTKPSINAAALPKDATELLRGPCPIVY